MSRANFAILISLGVAILAGCSDDTLAERMKACADYVNYGVLQNGEKQHCLADEQTFRKAAGELVAADLQQIYPALVNDAKAISASATKADLKAYPPLPSSVKNPTFFDNTEGTATSWPATVDLENVTFNPPDDTNRQWQISGNRAGNPGEPWVLDLEGFGPTQSNQIENICGLLDSAAAPGCKAHVYVRDIADSGGDLANLVAVAIELTPPPRDEAYQTLLGNEMARWPPRQSKQ
ncbi:hypothetical protein [Rhizobium sp. BK376]|uniref:hypothetical protein n=1 Tax=Rhizobium sp. BK376 TaxID=2512149 RepID=UPI0010539414|nr:hypothetical protein [Rhizobium sp. BK376]